MVWLKELLKERLERKRETILESVSTNPETFNLAPVHCSERYNMDPSDLIFLPFLYLLENSMLTISWPWTRPSTCVSGPCVYKAQVNSYSQSVLLPRWGKSWHALGFLPLLQCLVLSNSCFFSTDQGTIAPLGKRCFLAPKGRDVILVPAGKEQAEIGSGSVIVSHQVHV